ncbi:hypothetical protein Nepgr_024764 [Nepenthes gracilis]|uniref:Uncharacterized protein n=1 Tax=Nepenthes gracilis TaxID=150966 RepID=A0AAD3Y0U4_NEPGR|nr:hypothetical protein Nepgr_024764 [Nepenthes gracilis]
MDLCHDAAGASDLCYFLCADCTNRVVNAANWHISTLKLLAVAAVQNPKGQPQEIASKQPSSVAALLQPANSIKQHLHCPLSARQQANQQKNRALLPTSNLASAISYQWASPHGKTKLPTRIEQQRLSSSQQTNGHQHSPLTAENSIESLATREQDAVILQQQQRTDFNIQTAVGSSFSIGAAS